jgi:hypothetical protein
LNVKEKIDFERASKIFPERWIANGGFSFRRCPLRRGRTSFAPDGERAGERIIWNT